MSELTRHSDISILQTVAEYRVLTVAQIVTLLFSSRQVAGRRLRRMKEKGLLSLSPRSLSGARGRPENVISVTPDGTKKLRDGGILPGRTTHDRVGINKLHCVEHQLLVNWFRIYTLQIPKACPNLSVTFLSPISPFAFDGNALPIVSCEIPNMIHAMNPARFTPDGAFCITRESDGKSLLFMLEADNSTESIVSSKYDRRHIRKKIENYRVYLGRGLYQKYSDLFAREFRGFRVLFLASTEKRHNQLCRAIRDLYPSDFVWLSTRKRVSGCGVDAAAWAPGGRLAPPCASILGTEANRQSVSPPSPP